LSHSIAPKKNSPFTFSVSASHSHPSSLSQKNKEHKKKTDRNTHLIHHLERIFVIKMRVFLSILAPILLFKSLASASERSLLSLLQSSTQPGYYYSVSWYEPGCDADEESRSLAAISEAVDGVLKFLDLPEVAYWKTRVESNNRNRELQDETRGLRGLCDETRCQYSSCANSAACSEMYNCDECSPRELIQTERVLTAMELETLQDELVNVCEAALDDRGNGNGNYSPECRAAMIAATCRALVFN
jgi:hypothetical protein